MKFKLTEDTINSTQLNDENILAGDEIAVVEKNGKLKFYYNDGKRLKLVPKEKQVEYAREYENQRRRQEIESDPDYDPVKAAEDEKNRVDALYQGKTEVINKIKKALDSEKYHAKIDEPAKTKKSAFTRLVVNPNLKEIEDDITYWTNNLIADVIKKNKVKYKKKDFAPKHDVYADDIVGRDGVMLPTKNKHKKIEKEVVKQEIPYVLFFFDRSYSFKEKSNPEKTQLGKDLQAMFQKYKDGFTYIDEETKKKVEVPPNSLEFTTYYFGAVCSTDKTYSNFAGGNDPEVLLKTVKEVTQGHKANVVILTDSDNDGLSASDGVEINGNVWLVFANEYDSNLQLVIHGSEHTQQYFFRGIR